MISYGRMIIGACLLPLVLLSCRERHTPSTHPGEYNTLLQQVEAEARVREDSSMLLLRNTDNERIRALMLDLGVDYIRYNRGTRGWCVRGTVAALTAPAASLIASPVRLRHRSTRSGSDVTGRRRARSARRNRSGSAGNVRRANSLHAKGEA